MFAQCECLIQSPKSPIPDLSSMHSNDVSCPYEHLLIGDFGVCPNLYSPRWLRNRAIFWSPHCLSSFLAFQALQNGGTHRRRPTRPGPILDAISLWTIVCSPNEDIRKPKNISDRRFEHFSNNRSPNLVLSPLRKCSKRPSEMFFGFRKSSFESLFYPT